MKDQFFPGFEFWKIEKVSDSIEFDRQPWPYVEKDPMQISDIADAVDITTWSKWDLITGGVSVEEPVIGVWNRREARRVFTATLDELATAINEPSIRMKGKRLTFVTRNQMRPQNDEELQYLLDRYGEYIRDGGAGDCERSEEGTFRLRVAMAPKRRITESEIEVAAHEVGHTLGDHIDDPVWEELKADAFRSLFMKRFLRNGGYHMSVVDTSTVHDEALVRLEQLQNKRIPDEAILAHLTNRPFGRYREDDYLKFWTPDNPQPPYSRRERLLGGLIKPPARSALCYS